MALELLIIVLWLFIAGLFAWLADELDMNPIAWFLVVFFLGLLGILIMIVWYLAFHHE